MMNSNKQNFAVSFLAIMAVFMLGCRGDVVPSDSDMSSYGWNLYESGDYVEALDWFTTLSATAFSCTIFDLVIGDKLMVSITITRV